MVAATLLPPPAPDAHVRAELVCAARAAVPNKPFLAGLVLRMDPGWHVYWTNPGDTGIPTSVAWSVPKGWRVQPLEWPTPQVIHTAETTSFAYEREVVFLARITPAGAGGGAITANAKWLVCKEACVPGSASLSHRTPIRHRPEPDSVWANRLAKLQASLPHRDSRRSFVARRSGDAVDLATIALADGNPQFLPLDTNVFDSASSPVRRQGDTVHISLKRSQFANSLPARLRGLLIDGRNAVLVDVPILNTTR